VIELLQVRIRNKEALPGIKIVQVVHVTGEESLQRRLILLMMSMEFSLIQGIKNFQLKELGGTGRTHDWTVSKKIVELVDVPVFLAGGLNPENVTDAIQHVHPFGVDICSGVRTNGILMNIN